VLLTQAFVQEQNAGLVMWIFQIVFVQLKEGLEKIYFQLKEKQIAVCHVQQELDVISVFMIEIFVLGVD
jgi:hypothetical protein